MLNAASSINKQIRRCQCLLLELNWDVPEISVSRTHTLLAESNDTMESMTVYAY